MYLHLGQNVVVPQEDVIGIFDLDNTTCSKITRKFLSDAESAGRVILVSDELPRSFIVTSAVSDAACRESNEIKVLLSQLSPQTLLKRTEIMKGILI